MQENKEKQHFAVYSLKNDKILKDGHTMFTEDVVRDLNRKSFLEYERVNKVSITTVDLERLLKMSLRYALPSNGSSPSVVSDLFKEHIGVLRTEFIEWSHTITYESIKRNIVSDLHQKEWILFTCFLSNEIARRIRFKDQQKPLDADIAEHINNHFEELL